MDRPYASPQSRMATTSTRRGRGGGSMPLRKRMNWALACVMALLIGYAVVFGHNGLTAFLNKRAEARSLQLQMQELEKENARLQVHVDHLESDPAAIEHEAHDELHYTRPGEVIYKLEPTAGAQ